MSTKRSVDRSAVARKKDRASLCSFSFADGRHCSAPRCSAHPHFCYFHARKDAQSLAAQQMGRDVSSYLSGSYLSTCDLSSALGRLFSAVAQGQVKPRSASTLAYLGQTLLQSIHIAEHEYTNAFGSDSWRRTIRSSFLPPEPEHDSGPDSESDPEHAPLPSTPAGFVSALQSTLAKDCQNK